MIRENSSEGGSMLLWFKSSYSDSSNSNECVEVAFAPGAVRVRDSKSVGGPQLALAPTAWADFVSYASGG
ncbi:DUF397 domain-containing protein [Streptomyces sp. NPDC059819]|uniref:DUF397 domain-containing protein n=1 Tax=Streptomyces sp. NPDC059819 TaxID=3346963 RepID=UPI00364FDDE4